MEEGTEEGKTEGWGERGAVGEMGETGRRFGRGKRVDWTPCWTPYLPMVRPPQCPSWSLSSVASSASGMFQVIFIFSSNYITQSTDWQVLTKRSPTFKSYEFRCARARVSNLACV